MKKLISMVLVLSIIVSTLSLVGCNGDNDVPNNTESSQVHEESSNDTDNFESSEEASESGENLTVNETVPPPTSHVLEKEYERAVALNNDKTNLSLLYSVMNRAKEGEQITVATLGGSVTEGVGATDRVNGSYSGIFRDWWKATFPEANINHVNAGISGTTSYFGIHRLDDDVLSKSADICIVEFSVNDIDEQIYRDGYESIVTKLLDHGVAVILLFMLGGYGRWNCQSMHSQIGKKYALPMISFSDAIAPSISFGERVWTDIAVDDVHPNDFGYAYAGELIWKYLNSVWETCPPDALDFFVDKTSAQLRDVPYYNASKYDNTQITVSQMGSFVKFNESYKGQQNGWYSRTGAGGLEFSAEFKNLGFIFKESPTFDCADCQVYIDGELAGTIVAGNNSNISVYTSDESKMHNVRLVITEPDKQFYLASILLAK